MPGGWVDGVEIVNHEGSVVSKFPFFNFISANTAAPSSLTSTARGAAVYFALLKTSACALVPSRAPVNVFVTLEGPNDEKIGPVKVQPWSPAPFRPGAEEEVRLVAPHRIREVVAVGVHRQDAPGDSWWLLERVDLKIERQDDRPQRSGSDLSTETTSFHFSAAIGPSPDLGARAPSEGGGRNFVGVCAPPPYFLLTQPLADCGRDPSARIGTGPFSRGVARDT
jgi:hypothetical protein